MDESILNHLFLPSYLPSSADNDFLSENNHQNEHLLLEHFKKYFYSSDFTSASKILPIFQVLIDCLEHWSHLQNVQSLSVLNIQSTLEQLSPGSFLALYFRPQNAAILIEIDENNNNQALISAWQVLLSSEEITSSLTAHQSYFPVTSYRLLDRSKLKSKAHCELLMEFMHNTIEFSKSYKSTREVSEIREVPKSHYVCQWWIQHFDGIQIENNFNKSSQFTKKHRDQIRWNDASVPFRRSGLWMTIKVVLHTILFKRLGKVGTIIYKLLITHFLTHYIYIKHSRISTDLLVHCIRKIVRRLNKIDTNDMNEWSQYIKQDIQIKIDKILPKSNWYKPIEMIEKQKQLSLNHVNFDDSVMYQHSCFQLKDYLNNNTSNRIVYLSSMHKNYDVFNIVDQDDYIPSYDMLTKRMKYTALTALTCMEIWVETHLESWLNRPMSIKREWNRFETLLDFFEEYQIHVLNYCWSEKGPTDPIGYSRFILTSLTIICSMHKNLCKDKRFERLKLHSIQIPNLLNLFEFLILPNRDDMTQACNLYYYFREFNNKSYPDLLHDIKPKNSFGVYFAQHSTEMNMNIVRIRAQAEKDKQAKINEVMNAKQKYNNLMTIVNNSVCQYINNHHKAKRCKRCKTLKEANNIKVKIFECPIPTVHEDALAVIFELQMPIEIRSYRDIIWQFINRPKPQPENKFYQWLTSIPHDSKLKSFYTGSKNCKVKLVSFTKSVSVTHYSTPPFIASTPVDDFLFENSLQVQISPTKPLTLQDECRILTPQLDHQDYKQLQFAIDTTKFVQNDVIARLSTYSPRLKPSQLIEFGSFRSGHRLQWWNLLTILQLDSLSLAEESVAILIIHSILQNGPSTSDSWCPESHRQLLEDHFVNELIIRLNSHLDDCELNWQNELVLIVITMITMRIFTICNSTMENEVVNLIMKCRKIGEKWIELISKSIQTTSVSAFDEIEKLRLKMVTVGIACILTFSTHQNRVKLLLSSNEHIVFLLQAATTIHDNILLNKNESKMSIFMRNLMRFSERILVMIQPNIDEFLQKTFYQSLNDFTVTYWAVTKRKGSMNGQWKKRTRNPYDGWYDCKYESRHISIDFIRGTFLIDDMTIGFLPEKIIFNQLYIRVFGDYIFEVQAGDTHNAYITKHSYHNNQNVQYEFYFNDETNQLIVKERYRQNDDIFELIPHICFETELPDIFVSNYSHWWNAKNQIIQFRPIHFQDTEFLNNKSFILAVKTGVLFSASETNNTKLLVNQSSIFFQSLFNRYFIRLDEKPYVYMMQDYSSKSDNIIIHIHLSRLGIAFHYNTKTKMFISREYSDMCIAENQWLGTLTGLTSGLLLTPLTGINNHIAEYYPYRKLIVPFGKVFSEEILEVNHQIVSIQRSSTDPFLHQYFVFVLNDHLKILQSNDSPTGWLYLALLHAMTSHPLPDQYTGMTGMERAFQLLNSAGCYSDQPFDSISLNILEQIAIISPKVEYYPEHLTCMVKIDWNNHCIPYSMQHFGYYLIVKNLIETSQKLNFIYATTYCTKIPELFEDKKYDETLLKKLYWHYRDSYNPLARLPIELEENILCLNNSKPYQIVPKPYSHMINTTPVHLMNDLYKNGNVILKDCSQSYWLPLSQWLNDDNQLKNIWIGLFKMIVYVKTSKNRNLKEESERFEKLIDFLIYISNPSNTKLYYFQMLKTAMKQPIVSTEIIEFPPFIEYYNIEETSFVKRRINSLISYNSHIRDHIVAEVESYWQNHSEYDNINELTTYNEMLQINQLFISWKNNEKLRSFLEFVQTLIHSSRIAQFHTKVPYYSQSFAIESIQNHHGIQIKSINNITDHNLLSSANKRFNHVYAGHFTKLPVSCQTKSQQRSFPNQIFPSSDSKNDDLKEIGNYFKSHLNESWKKLLAEKQIQKENPSVEEIIQFLTDLRKESTQSWNKLVESITTSNEQLFDIGLITRITPTTLIVALKNKESGFYLTADQFTLLGGILVCWTLEQQLERALHYFNHNKMEDFTNEISNTPHVNWIPAEYIPWLILELEMNITIREIQINVARHMMQSNMTIQSKKIKNLVIQLNMGEGKTSVILPMLAVSLSSSDSSLVRIVVLKSLFPTNYRSLRYKLGGLLNKRILPFFCRRDMNFQNQQINHIFNRLKQGLHDCDIILTSPEDILSFDLLTIDKCRRKEIDVGRSMLTMQRWLKSFARDVLDESDEILHVKYQLAYTVGGQQSVDGGAERWNTIQQILHLVKKHANSISQHFSDEVCYRPEQQKGAFPEFRLQSQQPFSLLCEKIANDWLNQRSYRADDKNLILTFILKTSLSVEQLNNRFTPHVIQLFLIARGLLSSEVLLVALKKRYRVNYGISLDPLFNRLMAVPFRAKDVAADRTEFGHPDVALILTQLSYYYSGLNDSQMFQCFERLSEKESDPASIYDQWIQTEEQEKLSSSIKQWKGVNLKDYHQRTHDLFPILRYNMLIINYFLNHFVFPREAKQFPYKLVSSAWDLSSSVRSKPITGFSGTNDTQLLLPVHICQDDLPELQKTDAIVINNLLQSENENYQHLQVNSTLDDILHQIRNYNKSINVILDVGALLIDGTNRDIAIQWLNKTNKDNIDYAVYFDLDSIVVCDRQLHCYRFETSPASERLDRCIFYLDEVHTRGTDFKFPNGFTAVVTLGNGLTKDRFVQACMRMRKLGKSHSLIFWSSNEVHQQIIKLKKHSCIESEKENINTSISLIDILRWVYDNTKQSTWEGLHHWATQSLSFQRKIQAFQTIQWSNHQQTFSNKMMEDLANKCMEPETMELKRMYGATKVFETIEKIYLQRYEHCNYHLSNDIHKILLERLRKYGGTKQRLSQLLDEEHQRELEHELEEEQQSTRASPVKPCQPKLYEEIKQLCNTDGETMNIVQLSNSFLPLHKAFTNTTFSFFNSCQPTSWRPNFWISKEFQRVVETKGELLNPFLRPPRWIVFYQNKDIIFVSAFEANWLMGSLLSKKLPITTLRLLLPRIKRVQSIFVNTPALTIPPLMRVPNQTIEYFLPTEWLAQLFVFNGTLYFETVEEQKSYCQFLSLCPQPRTPIEEEAFEKGCIAIDGFVCESSHRHYLSMFAVNQFALNPLTFVKQLIENRNCFDAPISSHVGSIILNSHKLL